MEAAPEPLPAAQRLLGLREYKPRSSCVHHILVSPFSSLPVTTQHLLPACHQLTRWVTSRTVFSLEIVFVHPVVLTRAVGTRVHLTICKPLGVARF